MLGTDAASGTRGGSCGQPGGQSGGRPVMYAETASGRAEAAKGLQGTCPSCAAPVRPKCGSIVVHHWAHHARGECDPWSEPEGEWHRGWKLAVPPERREVVMGPHRADVVTASGGVVELQHSGISPEVIAEREAFYGERMAWIFDATEAFGSGRLAMLAPERGRPPDEAARDRRDRRDRRDMCPLAAGFGGPRPVDLPPERFCWKFARKAVGTCKRTVLLDLGDGTLMRVIQFERDGPVTGYGTSITRESVEGWLRDGTPWQHSRPTAPAAAGGRRVEDCMRPLICDFWQVHGSSVAELADSGCLRARELGSPDSPWQPVADALDRAAALARKGMPGRRL